MKKFKLYSIISVLITIIFFGTASICNQCGVTNTTEGNITAARENSAMETVAETTAIKETTTGTTAGTTAKETEGESKAPTIKLKIYEGPTAAGNICYYRVKATVTGNPAPTIDFSKDDSNGAWGKYISQVNLTDSNQSYTLSATATNSAGSDTDTITITWGCETPKETEPGAESTEETSAEYISILINNNTGGNLSLKLSGPANFNFNIPPGSHNIDIIPGTYSYTGKGCGGAKLSGTKDLSQPGWQWDWWCQSF